MCHCRCSREKKLFQLVERRLLLLWVFACFIWCLVFFFSLFLHFFLSFSKEGDPEGVVYGEVVGENVVRVM